jgi:hypothetical protein
MRHALFGKGEVNWLAMAKQTSLEGKENLAREKGWDPRSLRDDVQRHKSAIAACLATNAVCGLGIAAHRFIPNRPNLTMLFAAGACSMTLLPPCTNILQNNVTRARLAVALNSGEHCASTSWSWSRLDLCGPKSYLQAQSMLCSELEAKTTCLSLANLFLFGGAAFCPGAFGLALALCSCTQLWLHPQLYAAVEDRQRLFDMVECN